MNEKVEWNCVDDILAVLELARKGKWHWGGNWECKYIDIRIDMRDGHCILRDRDGKRISPEELRRQHSAPQGDMGWDWNRELMERGKPK